MRRKALPLIILLALVCLVISGCGGGTNKTEVTSDVTARLAQFEAGIEAYDVDALLGMLTSSFVLTITDDGVAQPDKSLAVLTGELQANEPGELAKRLAGYTMDLRFSNVMINAKSNNSASLTGNFTTSEEVPGLFIGEAGTISAELQKSGSAWYFSSMRLNFISQQN